MASRTMSAIASITIFLFLVCNVSTELTKTTTTWDHSDTSVNIENSLVSTSAKTTLFPTLDVTNTTLISTTPLNTSELSEFSTSTDVPTTQSTMNIAGSSTSKAIATPGSHPIDTAPSSGPSFSSGNQTYSRTSAGTDVTTTPLPTPMKPSPQNNGTTNGTSTTTVLSDTEKHSMMHSEIILTSIFSIMLVVVTLVLLFFGLKKCLRGGSQYSHHPLRETSYESVDRYAPPDDTLVISGGLYEAPRIYNPTMTVLDEEEAPNDYASFNSRPGQFRLEFLPGDKDLDPMFNGSQRRNV